MVPELNRRTFRFKPAHDVLLLREIARQRPWTAAHGETMSSWEAIGQSFNERLVAIRPNGPEIDPKACQRRYKALVDSYLSGDLASLRSTGTVDEVNEREQLIADLHHAAKEYRSDRTERRQSKGGIAEHAGFDNHGHVDAPPVSFQEPQVHSSSPEPVSTTTTTTGKRTAEQNGSPLPVVKRPRPIAPASLDAVPSSNVAWEFLQRYLHDESTRRQQELRLSEQRLELDKQRFELEKRERECHISTMNAQLDLIKQLVQQLPPRPSQC